MTAIGSKQVSMDDEVVARSAAGDPAARAELVSACLPRVWRTVYLTCGAGPDVEDLVQTAIVTAIESLGQYRGPDAFGIWLDRLTVNVVRTFLRKRVIRRIVSTSPRIEDLAHQSTGGPDRRLQARRLLSKLSVHLSRIKSKNRLALVLSLVHGYSAGEIARIVDCSEEAAWKRIRRGQKALAGRIERDPGFESDLEELFP